MSSSSYGCRLSQAEMGRLGRLLPMEYSPRELAMELKINIKRFWVDFVPAGCPHRRDGKGRLWIVGSAFREWYEVMLESRRHPMADDEGWCLRCGRAVLMVGPFVVIPQEFTEIVQGRCGRCGGKVNRARKREGVEACYATAQECAD